MFDPDKTLHDPESSLLSGGGMGRDDFGPFHTASGETEDLTFAALSNMMSTPDGDDDSDQAAPGSFPEPEEEQILLLRQFAEGGSGEIWEAIQPRLRRRVAVKRLKNHTRYLSSPPQISQQRLRLSELQFRQEALTAGYLEHPNILPVYDVAYDSNHRPMLVMKLVHGILWSQSIRQEWTTTDPMSFLVRHGEILATVANAVAFAHSRGILHRDLKPGQVMIGDYGDVLLMDWGLAMAWEKENPCEAPTPGPREYSPLFRPHNPAGTPTFMAPEQTQPQLDRLGPWTDCYLLGGILYILLTGRAPHWSPDGTQSMKLAATGQVIAPELVAPKGRPLPAELVELALHCLQPSIKDRLASPLEFRTRLLDWISQAIRHRQAESLITQTQVALIQPLARLPNDRAGYGPLADLIASMDRALALAPGHPDAIMLRDRLVLQLAQAAIAQGDLTLAEVQAHRLPPSEVRAQLLADILRSIEEQQRQDQEYRLALDAAREAQKRTEELRMQAEQTVRFLIHDLHQPLKSIGRLDLLRTAAEQALRHFEAEDNLASDHTDLHAIHNRAIAFLNIGEVLSDEGNKSDARIAFQRAVAQLQILASEPQANNRRWMEDHARALDRLAQHLYFEGQTEASRGLAKMALPILDQLARTAPDETQLSAHLLEQSTILSRIAHSYWRERKLDEATRYFSQSLQIIQAELTKAPQSVTVERSLATVLTGAANVHRDRAEIDQAIAINERIQRIRTRHCEQFPEHIPYLEDLFWTRNNLALMYQLAGRFTEAESLLELDIPKRRSHSEAMPASIPRRALLAFAQSLLAETRFLANKIPQAFEAYRQGNPLEREITDADPSPHYQAALSFSSGRLAEVALLGDPLPLLPIAELQTLIHQAHRTATQAHAKTPTNAFYTKCKARANLLKARLLTPACRDPEQRMVLPRNAHALLDEAEQLLSALGPRGADPAVDELRMAIALALRNDPEPYRPFLLERNWLSPMVRQIEDGHFGAADL